MGVSTKSLYETDFVDWAGRMAELLRAGRFDELDIENLVDEVESLAISQRRELRSRIARILEHMLKLKLSSGDLLQRNQQACRGSILRQRIEIRLLLKDSPSLGRLVEGLIGEAYQVAAQIVAHDFPKFSLTPPDVCPFSAAEILEEHSGW